MSEEITRTVSFKVSIDELLNMPNLMGFISTNNNATEEEVRAQLQKWKDEGYEFIPD